jgi:Uncharacterized conserved protein (DUF2358)
MANSPNSRNDRKLIAIAIPSGILSSIRIASTMTNNIIEALKADYKTFPFNQTFSLYAADVFFQDPWVSFRGVGLYRKMIQFIAWGFKDVEMDLHDIQQTDNQIKSLWTLRWIAPAPWKPKMVISGRSELTLNAEGLIQSHIDFWDCSRLDVLKQLFSR